MINKKIHANPYEVIILIIVIQLYHFPLPVPGTAFSAGNFIVFNYWVTQKHII